MDKLLIATNNRGKMKEMQALLEGLHAELLTPAQAGIDLHVTEDGRRTPKTPGRRPWRSPPQRPHLPG